MTSSAQIIYGILWNESATLLITVFQSRVFTVSSWLNRSFVPEYRHFIRMPTTVMLQPKFGWAASGCAQSAVHRCSYSFFPSCSRFECPTKNASIRMPQAVRSHQNALKQSLGFVFVARQPLSCHLGTYQVWQHWSRTKDVQVNEKRSACTSHRKSHLLLILWSQPVSLSFKLTPLHSTPLPITCLVLLKTPPQSRAVKEVIKMQWVPFSCS